MSGRAPLEDLVVVDASTIIAGPLAAEILAEYGATVIKVEHPELGDGSRKIGYTNATPGVWWKVLSQNKKCVTCRLSSPEGAELFKSLVARADVVIENFRPGRMEKWGLGYEELHRVNQRIVMLRITGFGQDGPYSSRPGYGTLAESMSGFADMTGQADGPPTLPAVPLADGMSGLMAVGACMTALWARDQPGGTGEGDVIDMSLYGSMVYAFGMIMTEYRVSGVLPTRRGNRLGNAPRNAWQCADGKWVAYSAQTTNMIDQIVRFVGKEDEPRFKEPLAGMKYGDELDALLGEWIGRHTRDDVIAKLVGAGVPIGPIYDVAELIADEQVQHRGDFVPVDDEQFGVMHLPVGPARFGQGAIESRFAGPTIGAHNDEIYHEWLGLSHDELSDLRAKDVI